MRVRPVLPPPVPSSAGGSSPFLAWHKSPIRELFLFFFFPLAVGERVPCLLALFFLGLAAQSYFFAAGRRSTGGLPPFPLLKDSEVTEFASAICFFEMQIGINFFLLPLGVDSH